MNLPDMILPAFAQMLDALSGQLGKAREQMTNEGARVDETRMIELKLQTGMIFDLDLPEYVRSWSIPQFYFHLITAYAIMRKEGIDLGKADYVPHMFRFVRDGTA